MVLINYSGPVVFVSYDNLFNGYLGQPKFLTLFPYPQEDLVSLVYIFVFTYMFESVCN